MTHHTEPHDWRWSLDQQDRNCKRNPRPYERLYDKAMPKPLAKTTDAQCACEKLGVFKELLGVTRCISCPRAGVAAVEPPPTHMVVCGPSGSVFVKEYDFFASQGGLTLIWGINWKPVWADDIEEARKQACTMFPNARPYEEQA